MTLSVKKLLSFVFRGTAEAPVLSFDRRCGSLYSVENPVVRKLNRKKIYF